MKQLMVFCILFSITTFAAQVAMFPLSMPEKGVSCSSTMFKIGSSCFLVTSAHCLNDLGTQVKIVSHQGIDYESHLSDFFHPQEVSSELMTSVLKIDTQMDLAQLEIPNIFEQRICENLDPLAILNENKLLEFHENGENVATLGFQNQMAWANYAGDLPWSYGIGYSYLHSYYLGEQHLPYLLEFRMLTTLPGMSGGAVIGYDGEVYGIIKGYVPFEDITIAILMKRVVEFLDRNPSQIQMSHIQTRKIMQLPVQVHFNNQVQMAGLNHLQNSGRNTQENGGDNGHAAGNDQTHDGRFWNESDPLSVFREPNEGVPCPFMPDYLIIGKEDGDYYQVDGWDDFNHFIRGQTDESERIHRHARGFPEQEIREDIFERLEGFYRFTNLFPLMPYHHLYMENDQRADRWEKVMSGQPLVEIWLEDNKLEITFFEHPLQPVGEMIGQQVSYHQEVFFVSMNSDARRITLHNQNYTLHCDNRHFLKLICSDTIHGVEFSLSVQSSEMNGKASFRWTRLISARSGHLEKPLVDFYFGELQKKDRDDYY